MILKYVWNLVARSRRQRQHDSENIRIDRLDEILASRSYAPYAITESPPEPDDHPGNRPILRAGLLFATHYHGHKEKKPTHDHRRHH